MKSTPLTQVTEDRFMGGALTVLQPKAGYRAGSDPIYMAAMVEIANGGRFLDLGTGVGTASLALLKRGKEIQGIGLDIQQELIDLAEKNTAANGLTEKFQPILADLMDPPKSVPYHFFDVVMSNPPWFEKGSITAPPTQTKAIGHLEEVSLNDWVAQMVRYLRPKGRFYMVHRADRLADILSAMANQKLGEVRVMPLWPKPGRDASRVIVTARKDFKTPFALLPGLVLHHEDGSYTQRAEQILRGVCGFFDTESAQP